MDEIDTLLESLDSIHLDTINLVSMTYEEYENYIRKQLEEVDESTLYSESINL